MTVVTWGHMAVVTWGSHDYSHVVGTWLWSCGGHMTAVMWGHMAVVMWWSHDCGHMMVT